MKLKLMNMAAMALSALLCLTTTCAWAGEGYPFTWSASNLYDGSGSYVSSGTAAYLVVSSLGQGTLLGVVNEAGYDAVKSAFESKEVEYLLDIAQVGASGAVNGEEIFFASVDGDEAYLLVFTGENLYVSETVTAASSAFAFGDQITASSASPKLASGGFQGAGWYTTSSSVPEPEPAGYSVSLKEGTEDDSNWQGKAGEGEYQALPLEGVAAGMAVTVKYIGTKKVKSVKAVKKAAADPLAVPLTMEALTAGNIKVNIVEDPWDEVPRTLSTGMKYSVNGGEKTTIYETTTIDVNAGDKVQFYGNGTSTQVYGDDHMVMLQGTAQTKVYGNIMSLINENDFATATTLTAESAFRRLFLGNTTLTDASGLLLPATALTAHCYQGMFEECTSLTTAPALPATTLAGYCYAGMFYWCTSLTAAPTLPATTLAAGCYADMFQGCSLTTAPELPATTLASECYSGMFYGCESLTAAPTLPATTLAYRCYFSMFEDCTSLTAAPELPATTLANYCYTWMFSGCTSLTTAPTLPATTLAEGCYNSMFYGCTSLSSITCLATTGINENESTFDWLDGVPATGTFNRASGANWPTGNNGIPSGWTLVPPAPAATVTTAPTAKTGVKAGQNEAIVNAGTPEGGTMMYAVTTDNTQPASTDGFSATVPTAEGLTAGTYYVWYYVEGDASHTDSEISATGIEVTIAAPAATVTTAPTAKTGVKAGQNEAIVNAGTVEGGTMMYMVNATQPASTDGFSDTVPTAETLAAGTYYVWYYVKADASHTDSEISASGIEVTIAAAGPKAAAEATAEDIGKIVGADGKIYATKDAAEAVATGNAIAMIAYVGTASDCAHGLAIALEDVSSSNYAWGDAADAVTTWASGKTPPTGCSWRLPSIKDWQYMFIGCGASGSYSDNPSSMSYSGLASKLTTAQGDAFQAFPYWSSTVYNSWGGSVNVWVLMFDEYAPEYGDCNANFNTTNTGFDDSPRVRACLAF